MKKISIITLLVFWATVSFAQDSYEKAFQIGFITPISSNGTNSHLYTNKVSLNLLGGYSKGNTGLELGGLYNINLEETKGSQFAGLVNYSGSAEKAIQFAGIANINKSQAGGAQFAGIANLATSGNVGFQMSGIANVAEEANVQISGILNVAKNVKGLQLGLINISENNSGLPIGLINIVKNGGKREFEVAVSDVINASASFKLGTNRFYTIFSGGIVFIDNPVEYATGLGFGTQIDYGNGWSNQIEIMGYTVTKNKKFRSDVNMLNQLKFTMSKELAPHLKFFAGPVLNLTVSDHIDSNTGEHTNTLAPYTIWKKTSGKTELKGWIGASAGVRF